MQNMGMHQMENLFLIGDPNEVWIMEVMSKGEGELGSVWVAQKIPDGYVSGHANQAHTHVRRTIHPRVDFRTMLSILQESMAFTTAQTLTFHFLILMILFPSSVRACASAVCGTCSAR